jgi:hypothetical protein
MTFALPCDLQKDKNFQGCVKWRIEILRRIVFNAYLSVLNKSGCIIRLQNLRIFGLLGSFRPKNGLSVSFNAIK